MPNRKKRNRNASRRKWQKKREAELVGVTPDSYSRMPKSLRGWRRPLACELEPGAWAALVFNLGQLRPVTTHHCIVLDKRWEPELGPDGEWMVQLRAASGKVVHWAVSPDRHRRTIEGLWIPPPDSNDLG